MIFLVPRHTYIILFFVSIDLVRVFYANVFVFKCLKTLIAITVQHKGTNSISLFFFFAKSLNV